MQTIDHSHNDVIYGQVIKYDWLGEKYCANQIRGVGCSERRVFLERWDDDLLYQETGERGREVFF